MLLGILCKGRCIWW